MTLGAHVVKARHSTQKVISLSVGEAEYYGVVKGSAMGKGIQSLLQDMGLKLGLKEQKKRVAEENPVLERAYKTKGKISEKEVDALAFETQLTPLQVRRNLSLY